MPKSGSHQYSIDFKLIIEKKKKINRHIDKILRKTDSSCNQILTLVVNNSSRPQAWQFVFIRKIINKNWRFWTSY